MRQLRARNDISCTRVFVGIALGAFLTWGVPTAAYQVALLIHEVSWFSLGIYGMAAAMLVGTLVAFDSIWARLIALVCCVPIWLYLSFVLVVTSGCRLQGELGVGLTACL